MKSKSQDFTYQPQRRQFLKLAYVTPNCATNFVIHAEYWETINSSRPEYLWKLRAPAWFAMKVREIRLLFLVIISIAAPVRTESYHMWSSARHTDLNHRPPKPVYAFFY